MNNTINIRAKRPVDLTATKWKGHELLALAHLLAEEYWRTGDPWFNDEANRVRDEIDRRFSAAAGLTGE